MLARCPALLVPLALALGLLGGCKRKPAPGAAVTCDAMATHVTKLAKADLAASPVGPDQRRRAETELAPLHDVMQAVCQERAWPAEVRSCVAGATAGGAVAQCVAVLPADDRAPLRR
jgi:hypothetical protein